MNAIAQPYYHDHQSITLWIFFLIFFMSICLSLFLVGFLSCQFVTSNHTSVQSFVFIMNESI